MRRRIGESTVTVACQSRHSRELPVGSLGAGIVDNCRSDPQEGRAASPRGQAVCHTAVIGPKCTCLGQRLQIWGAGPPTHIFSCVDLLRVPGVAGRCRSASRRLRARTKPHRLRPNLIRTGFLQLECRVRSHQYPSEPACTSQNAPSCHRTSPYTTVPFSLAA